MLARLLVPLLALTLAMTACSSDDDTASAHSLTLHAQLNASDDGMLAFLSPSATIGTYLPAAVVGKPYYLGVFPAGFSPGNDPALFEKWGTVPASLDIVETTPAMFASGAYDMVLVLYVATPVSDDQLALREIPPVAAGGDLASFTLSSADVRPGDPDQALGTLRMNVEDADAMMEIANRTPTDPMDVAQTTAAFEHTILYLP